MADRADPERHHRRTGPHRVTEDQLALIRSVGTSFDSLFTWDYEKGQRQALNKLYEKAKVSQWNAETDIDWSVAGQIDARPGPEQPAQHHGRHRRGALRQAQRGGAGHAGPRRHGLDAQPVHARRAGRPAVHGQDRGRGPLDRRQVLRGHPGHGRGPPRRGVLQVPPRQARVGVPGQRPPPGAARHVLSDPRWDFTYLGMQIMVEGLALAAFGFQYQFSPDPCSSRSPATSCPTRPGTWPSASSRCRRRTRSSPRPRSASARSSATRPPSGCGTGSCSQEVWEELGMPVKECCEIMLNNPLQLEFRKVLFSKIVPNLKKLGLLDAGDGWLRHVRRARGAGVRDMGGHWGRVRAAPDRSSGLSLGAPTFPRMIRGR